MHEKDSGTPSHQTEVLQLLVCWKLSRFFSPGCPGNKGPLVQWYQVWRIVVVELNFKVRKVQACWLITWQYFPFVYFGRVWSSYWVVWDFLVLLSSSGGDWTGNKLSYREGKEGNRRIIGGLWEHPKSVRHQWGASWEDTKLSSGESEVVTIKRIVDKKSR